MWWLEKADEEAPEVVGCEDLSDADELSEMVEGEEEEEEVMVPSVEEPWPEVAMESGSAREELLLPHSLWPRFVLVVLAELPLPPPPTGSRRRSSKLTTRSVCEG